MKIPDFSFQETLDNEAKEFFNWIRILVNKGKIAFGSVVDGNHGENIEGEHQVIADTGDANTEFSVTHTLGRIPTGYLVTSNNKAAVVYTGTTTWTSTTIYLRCDAANCAISVFIIP